MQSVLLVVVSFLLYALCIYSEEVEITVPLKFGDTDLQLSFPANRNAALNMAEKFCIEKAMASESQMDSCLETIGEYLASAVEKHNKKTKFVAPDANEEEVLTISLQIGTIVYDLEYKYELQSSEEAALQFCTKNMKSLGITDHSIRSCVDPVVAQLDATLAKHLQSHGKPVPAKKPKFTERTVRFEDLAVHML